MTLRNLFIFNTVINLLFGVPLVLAPKLLVDMYFVDPSQATAALLVVARAYGSLIFGLGVALWSARNAQASLGRRAILQMVVVANAIVAAIYTYAVLTNVYNSMGWSIVAINVTLAAWGGSLLAKEMGFELK
ncbi:MAG: hypothetical protein U0Y10_26030 [Spirosomataceae bacterium]